jgi:hypothetical protein
MSDTKEFVLKDKFSYIYDGYEKFYFVDLEENMYDLDKMVVKNVYFWKKSVIGDKITLDMKGQRYNVVKIN